MKIVAVLRRLSLLVFLTTTCKLAAQIEAALWKSKSPNVDSQLHSFYPRPSSSGSQKRVLVIPLLGPDSALLAGGKVRLWVGRDDGIALSGVDVIVRVPENGNMIYSPNGNTTEITVRTDAAGIVEVTLVAPDVPSNGSGSAPPAS